MERAVERGLGDRAHAKAEPHFHFLGVISGVQLDGAFGVWTVIKTM